MSLQVRLTFVFLILAAPVLCAFGAAVYLVTSRLIYQSVDHSLVSRGETVYAAIQRVQGPLTAADIEASRRGLDRLALASAAFQLRDQDFRPIYSSTGIFSTATELAAPPEHRRYATIRADGDRLRSLTMPLVSYGELIGYAETTASLSVVDSALGDIRAVLLIGGMMVLAGTALPAYLLAGRAIDPVRRVSRLAREIERTADFSRRLTEGHSTGEMKELTDTFNKMIDRVEKMMLAQRSFLADSSHELRRPLTLLRTNIDVINDPGLTDSDRREIESEMRAEAESMSQLVADLVLLSREGHLAFAFKAIDLSETCREAITQARSAFPRHQFICEMDRDMRVLADEGRFQQVLANLLQNAAAYSPEQSIILLRLKRQGDQIELEIADYGTGMTAADVEHAFDRFYRGSSAREHRTEGYGLGLAIVKHIVESHGGNVSIASRPGEGTSVKILLPVYRDTSVASGQFDRDEALSAPKAQGLA
jgi:two-component system sensor histidine kinase MprB